MKKSNKNNKSKITRIFCVAVIIILAIAIVFLLINSSIKQGQYEDELRSQFISACSEEERLVKVIVEKDPSLQVEKTGGPTLIDTIPGSDYFSEDCKAYLLYDRYSTAKPAIYLYPEQETQVTISLDYNGHLINTVPYSDDGTWLVNAEPNGTLIDPQTGKEYPYIFWDGTMDSGFSIDEGFVVAGSDAREFLTNTLPQTGLLPNEYNEMIDFWTPILEQNSYNLISFIGQDYIDQAKLDITPTPDSILRVFMAIEPLDEPIDIAEQKLTGFERVGFTVVEWGGGIFIRE